MGEPWFGSKTYGIGIGPKTPAGWTSVAIYFVLMTVTPLVERSLFWPEWSIAATLAALTLAFLLLMLVKSDGKPWRWRWGGR